MGLVPTFRGILEECLGKPVGEGSQRHALRMEALERAHHGVTHLLENLYGGRVARGHIRTMCSPTSTLLWAPVLERKNGRGRRAHSTVNVRQRPRIGFPIGRQISFRLA